MRKNKIPNTEYKEFIETAFARYFNSYNLPIIASICSASLYNHLMARHARSTSSRNWTDIDILLEEESKEFETGMEAEELEYQRKIRDAEKEFEIDEGT